MSFEHAFAVIPRRGRCFQDRVALQRDEIVSDVREARALLPAPTTWGESRVTPWTPFSVKGMSERPVCH